MLLSLVAGLFMSTAAVLPAVAATTVVVTPANQQGWSTADTRPGGAVTFINDSTSPAPNGALQLTTDASTAAKAQYLHAASTSLSAVTDLSYYTKQVAPAGTVADPAYQLAVCLTGTTSTGCNPGLPGTTSPTSSFSTLVFEPYQNPGNNGNASIVNGAWQKWDVDQGLFWSTRKVVCSGGTINGTPGGPATYTLAAIKAACPNAVVTGYGVNIGTVNPGYNVETDLFNFNGMVYDFQLTNVPTIKSDCKNNGFVNFTDANGNAFTTQGACVATVASSGNRIIRKNINNVSVSNTTSLTSISGNASVTGNTIGGNATSGGASASSSTSTTVNISN